MKICIIGNDRSGTLERFYEEGLVAAGVEVSWLPIRRWWDDKRTNIIAKVVSRIAPRIFCRDINVRVLEFVRKNGPDVVIVFKGMELFPETVNCIKSLTRTVMYNPDHPYIYSGRGSGNEWMKQSIPSYDLYITYAEDIKNDLIKNGVASAVIPFGFSLKQSEFEEIENTDVKNKLCFLGNGDEQRANVLNYLAGQGIPVVVYGGNWEGSLSAEIEKHDGAYGLSFWKVLRRYAVQLNIMRPHNLNSHNMRSFDIPAAGGIQLAPRTPDHENYFEENESIFLYDNLDDCYKKAKYLLEMSADQAKKVREQARLVSLNKGYSYAERSKRLFDLLTQLVNRL